MGADGGGPPLLQTLADFYDDLPFEYILVGHCLIVASWFPRLKDRYLLSYWVRCLCTSAASLLPLANLQSLLAPPHPLSKPVLVPGATTCVNSIG